ncbi:MAG TPA: electron transfer flavoprotein-ubiquinone oxidoreductase [Candidatus Saccharimonadales bacterium]|nr:electron transfer flavoprotein-ubiquinone oxidoreductase [Candidatus Saccharimonadales bacterium]
MPLERESLEFDALFVGAGPAGLAGAIHLARLAAAHNEAAGESGRRLPELNIAVIEKGGEVGAHGISGAVMDPRGLAELLPDWRDRGCPVESPVTSDDVLLLTRAGRFRLPVVPPPLQNHGNYVVSLGNLVRWMAQQAEALGVNVFPGFPAQEPLLDGERLVGVRCADTGLDRAGRPKPNHQLGPDLLAKVTALCEGPRGTVTKILDQRLKLSEGRDPMVYSSGVKEVWEMPAGRVPAGRVIHTLGWPLPRDTFGGGFVYGMGGDRWAVGMVTGLDAPNPLTSPHLMLQLFKTHPLVKGLLDGGKMVSYGAKAIPESGLFSMPRMAFPGGLLCGDSAAWLNPMRLKGIHLAIKSGMLAAETIFEALLRDDFGAGVLAGYERRFRQSWAYRELHGVRNFHQGFEGGLWAGLLNSGIQMFTGGGLGDRHNRHAGHERMRRLAEYGPGGPPRTELKFDGTLTFDRLTDVYNSGTTHEENQPCHLVVRDTEICATRCREEFGNPCQHFCPAQVYEMEQNPERGRLELKINASNCVHCKTCDILDPYQVIDWTTPEGGGGPDYKNL